MSLPRAFAGASILVATIALPTHTNLVTHAEEQPRTTRSAPGLVLQALSPERVAGTFAVANQPPFVFEGQRTAFEASFSIRRDSVLILDYREDDNILSLTTSNGTAGWTAIKPLLGKAIASPNSANDLEQGRLIRRAVKQHGDQSSFEQLVASDTGLALVALSAALGERGLNGKAFPPLAFVHMVAMRIGTARGLSPPQRSNIEARQFLTETDSSCQSLADDPNGDNCRGMCGPGCTCWVDMCGDCCCHSGCKSHDTTCRNCVWYKPWNCEFCASFISFTWGGCGDGCQANDYWEPFPYENYAQCGTEQVTPFPSVDQWGNCGGRHEGSTEDYAAPPQWSCNRAEPTPDGTGAERYALRCFPQ